MNKRLLLVMIVIFIILIVVLVFTLGKVNLQVKAKQNPSISTLFAQAKDLEAKGNLFEAKAMYQRLMNEFPSSSEIMNWQKKIEEINMKLLFSPILIPKSILYEIKPGDTLAKIAKEFKMTAELIMRSNNLADDKILSGRKIKIWTAPFVLVIDKSQNTLILKSGEEVIKTYIVSTGANNSTPVGTFKIINKIPNPTWFKAGAVVAAGSPENILGSRWLGFDLPGYGIHGTIEPQNLGKQVTQGCIRMSNSDIEELYTIVPADAEVTIVD